MNNFKKGGRVSWYFERNVKQPTIYLCFNCQKRLRKPVEFCNDCLKLIAED